MIDSNCHCTVRAPIGRGKTGAVSASLQAAAPLDQAQQLALVRARAVIWQPWTSWGLPLPVQDRRWTHSSMLGWQAETLTARACRTGGSVVLMADVLPAGLD
jgi:hypothetical protein